ncbi:TPA: hypothetical protein ACT5B2_000115 [Burkholderia cenocepacia]
MTKLYILNTTAQNYNVFFRLPEVVSAQYAELAPGEQQCVHEGDTEAIDFIVKQLGHYGIIDGAEYNRSLTAAVKTRAHMLFRIDRPFSFSDQEAIVKGRAIAQNENAIEELRTETAALGEIERKFTNGKTAKRNQVEITAKPVHVQEGDQSLARGAEDIAKFELSKD